MLRCAVTYKQLCHRAVALCALQLVCTVVAVVAMFNPIEGDGTDSDAKGVEAAAVLAADTIEVLAVVSILYLVCKFGHLMPYRKTVNTSLCLVLAFTALPFAASFLPASPAVKLLRLLQVLGPLLTLTLAVSIWRGRNAENHETLYLFSVLMEHDPVGAVHTQLTQLDDDDSGDAGRAAAGADKHL